MKIKNLKLKIMKYNKGMTYVELIVVLSIFSIMTSVVLFNYGTFQAKVDIKNLASDIALQIVQAQKDSISGKFPLSGGQIANWKPSYGVYFNYSSASDSSDGNIAFNKKFVYFADLNNASGYESGAGEKLNTIYITKGNFISGIDRCISVTCSPPVPISPLAVIFKRPNSDAIFKDSNGAPLANDFNYIQITISSPQSNPATANIQIYRSGRVQIN